MPGFSPVVIIRFVRPLNRVIITMQKYGRFHFLGGKVAKYKK